MENKQQLINECNGVEWKVIFVQALFSICTKALVFQCHYEAEMLSKANEIEVDELWRMAIATKVLIIRLGQC
jgi:hypothetical protein